MTKNVRLKAGFSLLASSLIVSLFLSMLMPSVDAKSHKSSSVGTSTSKKKKSRHHRKTVAAKPRYAYPLDFFMMHAPEFDKTPLEEGSAHRIANAFACGIADECSAPQLVRAGVFHHHPLSGGIFRRREPVKYVILHSTETGVPVPSRNVINSWNSMGRRHPGAQFVVDRDGTIYMALDPDFAAVHVNIFKTLPGINNDNSIGIEMNHTGRQDYPLAQRAAVARLVTYLQHRYSVTSDNVITHKYAQQGDHTDPVHFDLEGFLATKEDFRLKALSMKRQYAPVVVEEEKEENWPVASIYVQIHGPIKLSDVVRVIEPKSNKTLSLVQNNQ